MPAALGAIISITTQVALAIVIVSASTTVMPTVKRPFLRNPTFITAVFLPSPELEPSMPAPPEVTLGRAVESPEPAPELPAPVPVRNFEALPVPKPTVAETRPVSEPPRPAPPAPAPPKPTVGAFPNAAAIARAPEPAKRVEAAGFDAPVARTAESKLGTATVGAFDSATTQGERRMGADSAKSQAVTESGFNQQAAAVPASQQSKVIRETGFGTSNSPQRPRTPEQQAVLKPAGFSDARVTEPARKPVAAPAAPAVIAVEVLSKPTPVYTEQARRLKIEGEVVLEVEFAAAGSVRVVRIVKSLGHGLDEAATSAAQQIQFKPAMSEGRPVDYRTTVQIVFRIA